MGAYTMSRIYKCMMLVILSVGLSSCNSNTPAVQNRISQPDSGSKGILDIVDGRTGNYGSQEIKEFEMKGLTAEMRAELLAEKIEEMDAIDKAYVVVTGNTAIVGIDLEQEMNDAKLIELKRVIERRVVAADQGIKHAVVTASKDLVEKILKMVGENEHKAENEVNELAPFGNDNTFFKVAPMI